MGSTDPSSTLASEVGGAVAEEIAGAGAEGGGGVVAVVEGAGLQREAAAPDAGAELVAQPFEHRDLLVESGPPALREPLPVGLVGCPLPGEGGEGIANLV